MIYELIFAAAGFALGYLLARRPWKKRHAETTAPEHGEDYASALKHNAKMWNILSDALPLHVYIKNADDNFRYVYSNKTRNDFFKLTSEELIGHNDMVLLTPDAARVQLAKDAKIMTKPQGVYEDFIITGDQDGKKHYFRIAQTQFTDADGTRLLLGAALDITELEESRRELGGAKKRLEERDLWLSRTLTSIGDAVIATDRHGNTMLLNPVAERMLGVKNKDAVGKPHDEIFHIVGAMDNEPRPSPVGRALRTGAPVELANHTDLISGTGERFHISDSAAPILDEEHNVLGAVLVFRDVTEAYQRRAALRDAVNDWEMASEIGNIASFRMDYRTRKVIGSRRLAEFWPIKDGRAVPLAEWVLPEYAVDGDKLFIDVSEGRAKQAHYEYCAGRNGKVRRYRIFCAADTDHPGEITGIVQDVTEAYENEKVLENTRLMWNNFIDILPLHFFAKNADDSFRYTLCNKRFAEFTGKPEEEITGKSDAELFGHPGDREHFETNDRIIVESGKACKFTETAYGAGKRPMQFQTVKMPCAGPNGEHLLLGVSIDVTELATLNKSQEIIRQGLEMLVEETDVNEGIAKAMKLVCEYIGVSRSYILHFDTEKKTVSCVREYCQPGERNLLEKLQDVPWSTGLDWQKHFKNECFYNFPELQDDETLKLLGPFYAKMIRENDFHSLYCHRLVIDGKFWGYVGLAYEKETRVLDKQELDFVQSAARFIELMIRHKRVQQELREAVIQANAAEQAKSRFLATMSHEIRTPLNAVIGFSELLKDGTLPPAEQKDYLNDIAIAGNALLALINDILDLSKLEAGKMQFARTPTDFSMLVREIMIVFQQKLKDKHLVGNIAVRDIPTLKLDPLRMRQILFNLVGNAVKFTDSGSITVSAQFTPDPDGKKTGTFRFSVRDTGCGISEEDSKHLFQPFVQSNALLGTRKAGCGSGLGLMLVRRMLEYMNGEIVLESKPGAGSEFTVTLHDVEYTTDALEDAGAENAAEETAGFSCSALIVDDVPMNLKVMQAMLRKIGVESVTADSGEEALEELKKRPFDLLLTDLWMPGMTGMELAGKIRRSGRYPDLRIAVVTADTEAGNNFDSQTFDAVLSKPVTIEKLRYFIEKMEKEND